MKKSSILVAAFGLASQVAGFYTGNMNYFSPSQHHPSLGVSIRKVAARTYAASPWSPSQLNFTHGVASGDPLEDSVILWTRVSPTLDDDASNVTVSGYVELYSHETDAYVQASKAPVCVEWKVSEKKDLSSAVSSGRAYTSSDIDFTVKVGDFVPAKMTPLWQMLTLLQVEAKGLKAFTQYCRLSSQALRKRSSDRGQGTSSTSATPTMPARSAGQRRSRRRRASLHHLSGSPSIPAATTVRMAFDRKGAQVLTPPP